MLAIHEIIVERYHLRLQQTSHQLYGQTLRERRLAARRRPRYQHYPGSPLVEASRYLVGQSGYAVVMERLADIDQHRRPVVGHSFVKFAAVADANDGVEAQVIGERFVHFLLTHRTARFRRIGRIRAEQQQPVFVKLQIKHSEHTGRRSKLPVVRIAQTVQTVIHRIQVMKRLKQAHLVIHPLTAENLCDVRRQTLLTLKPDVAPHKIFHIRLQTLHRPLVESHIPASHTAVIAPRKRMHYLKPRTRQTVVDSLVEHHAQRSYVSAVSRIALHRQILHHLGSIYRETQILGLIVDPRAYRREAHTTRYASIHVEQRFATLYIDIFLDVDTIYLKSVAHICLSPPRPLSKHELSPRLESHLLHHSDERALSSSSTSRRER